MDGRDNEEARSESSEGTYVPALTSPGPEAESLTGDEARAGPSVRAAGESMEQEGETGGKPDWTTVLRRWRREAKERKQARKEAGEFTSRTKDPFGLRFPDGPDKDISHAEWKCLVKVTVKKGNDFINLMMDEGKKLDSNFARLNGFRFVEHSPKDVRLMTEGEREKMRQARRGRKATEIKGHGYWGFTNRESKAFWTRFVDEAVEDLGLGDRRTPEDGREAFVTSTSTVVWEAYGDSSEARFAGWLRHLVFANPGLGGLDVVLFKAFPAPKNPDWTVIMLRGGREWTVAVMKMGLYLPHFHDWVILVRRTRVFEKEVEDLADNMKGVRMGGGTGPSLNDLYDEEEVDTNKRTRDELSSSSSAGKPTPKAVRLDGGKKSE